MNALGLLSVLLGTAFVVAGVLCIVMVGVAVGDIARLKRIGRGHKIQNLTAIWLFACGVILLWGAVRMLLLGGGP